MMSRHISFAGYLILAGLFVPSASKARQSDNYEVVPVNDGATLIGRVIFDGDAPRPRRFMITKDVEVCGLGYRERKEVDVTDDGGLRNVVIIIDGISAGKAWAASEERHTITQENCTFSPHLQVVRRGAELDILNPDPVLHNIHGFELIGRAWRTLFNFGQPPEERVITHALRPRRGHEIRLECDAHDFMLSWIYAADHPYTVVVDDAGRFVLEDIPPGTYTIRAWHPYVGTVEQEISLAPNAEDEVLFTFSSQ